MTVSFIFKHSGHQKVSNLSTVNRHNFLILLFQHFAAVFAAPFLETNLETLPLYVHKLLNPAPPLIQELDGAVVAKDWLLQQQQQQCRFLRAGATTTKTTATTTETTTTTKCLIHIHQWHSRVTSSIFDDVLYWLHLFFFKTLFFTWFIIYLSRDWCHFLDLFTIYWTFFRLIGSLDFLMIYLWICGFSKRFCGFFRIFGKVYVDFWSDTPLVCTLGGTA